MVKTKIRPKAKAKSAPALTEKPLISNKSCSVSCTTSCFICSVFKVMVTVFVLLLIFWLGFSLGALSLGGNFKSKNYGMSTSKVACARNMNPDIKNKSCLNKGLNQASGQSLALLTSKTGDEFDKEFMLQLTINHQASLEMANLALTKSNRADIKALAQKIIDSHTKDIEQMKTWQVDWFKTE